VVLVPVPAAKPVAAAGSTDLAAAVGPEPEPALAAAVDELAALGQRKSRAADGSGGETKVKAGADRRWAAQQDSWQGEEGAVAVVWVQTDVGRWS
jgi:hypothetical protein